MFTGIIEETGTIKSIRSGGSSGRITISASRILEDMQVGDSINTNGVCLTVTEFSAAAFTVDVMPETMHRSAFRELRTGSRVNLERAIRLSDRLGGHLVSGHVDGTGKIIRTWSDENAVWFRIEADATVLKYLIEKGSVAIDGISLTLVNPSKSSFDVSVIPHTLGETTMSARKVGDLVNIECDMVGKYIEKFMGKKDGNISMNFLAENGFV